MMLIRTKMMILCTNGICMIRLNVCTCVSRPSRNPTPTSFAVFHGNEEEEILERDTGRRSKQTSYNEPSADEATDGRSQRTNKDANVPYLRMDVTNRVSRGECENMKFHKNHGSAFSTFE